MPAARALPRPRAGLDIGLGVAPASGPAGCPAQARIPMPSARARTGLAAAFAPVLCAALCTVLAALPPAGGAAALTTVDFETVRLEGGRLIGPGFTARALGPGDVVPGWDGPAGGGALRLEDLGEEGFGGARGLALSTRDLSFPYGFSLDFEAPAASVSGLWVAANRVWEGTAYGDGGAVLARFDIAADAGRFAVEAPEGIVRLDLRASGGWDWLWLDDLAFAAALSGGDAVVSAAASGSPAPVPLPGALPLLAAALGGAVGLRAVFGAASRRAQGLGPLD